MKVAAYGALFAPFFACLGCADEASTASFAPPPSFALVVDESALNGIPLCLDGQGKPTATATIRNPSTTGVPLRLGARGAVVTTDHGLPTLAPGGVAVARAEVFDFRMPQLLFLDEKGELERTMRIFPIVDVRTLELRAMTEKRLLYYAYVEIENPMPAQLTITLDYRGLFRGPPTATLAPNSATTIELSFVRENVPVEPGFDAALTIDGPLCSRLAMPDARRVLIPSIGDGPAPGDLPPAKQ